MTTKCTLTQCYNIFTDTNIEINEIIKILCLKKLCVPKIANILADQYFKN